MKNASQQVYITNKVGWIFKLINLIMKTLGGWNLHSSYLFVAWMKMSPCKRGWFYIRFLIFWGEKNFPVQLQRCSKAPKLVLDGFYSSIFMVGKTILTSSYWLVFLGIFSEGQILFIQLTIIYSVRKLHHSVLR